jgi:hypothetical protein
MAENRFGDPAGVEQTIYSKGNYQIHLRHLPSGQDVKFKAFLTQFEDQFTSDWNTEQVFGRMDPIKNYRGTQRIITLGWDVVANDLEEAKFNLENCSLLLSMLYPSFESGEQDVVQTSAEGSRERTSAQDKITSSTQDTPATVNGNTTRIQGAPLFKLKFANLIQSTRATGQDSTIEDGLVGAIDGLTYSPDVEQGFFDPEPGILYPQTIRLSFGFTVAHDHALGWSNNKLRGNLASFPYPKGGE